MTCVLAQADDTSKNYAGLSLTTAGNATARSRTGELVSDRSRLGAKIYGGIQFNRNFALEAGYGSFGSHTLKNTGSGPSGDARLGSDMLYGAAKGSYLLGERFSLFGKLGVARTRAQFSGFDEPDFTMTRAMVGVGVEYKISSSLALGLEFDNYGSAQTASNRQFNLRKVEAGLTLRF